VSRLISIVSCYFSCLRYLDLLSWESLLGWLAILIKICRDWSCIPTARTTIWFISCCLSSLAIVAISTSLDKKKLLLSQGNNLILSTHQLICHSLHLLLSFLCFLSSFFTQCCHFFAQCYHFFACCCLAIVSLLFINVLCPVSLFLCSSSFDLWFPLLISNWPLVLCSLSFFFALCCQPTFFGALSVFPCSRSMALEPIMQMINLQGRKVLSLRSWALLYSSWVLILDSWFLKPLGLIN